MLWRLVFDVKYASLCFCRLQHNFSFEAMEKEENVAPQKSSTALNSATELFVTTSLSLKDSYRMPPRKRSTRCSVLSCWML